MRPLASQYLAPLVPGFLPAPLRQMVDKAIALVDTVLSDDSEKASDQRATLFAFLIRVGSAALAFVSQVFFARWLGTHEYGIFVWIWTMALIAASMACLGMSSALVRFIPQYRQQGDFARLRGILATTRWPLVLWSSFLAGLGVLTIYTFEDRIPADYVGPLLLTAACLPMLALADIQDGVGRGFAWIPLALGPPFLLRPLLILAMMAVAAYSGWPATASTTLLLVLIATTILSIWQTLALRDKIATIVPKGPKVRDWPVWLKVALPIFVVEGFFALLFNADIIMVGALMAPADVAVYFAAVKTLALVHFVYFAVKAGAAHRISQYHQAGDREQYEEFVHATVKWTFWPSFAVALVLLAVGKPLLFLFGAEFTSGYPVLAILTAGIVARAAVGPAESILTMSNQQNICAVIYAGSLATNIGLNLLLIPIYGLWGAGLATLLALVFEALCLSIAIKARLGFNVVIFASFFPRKEA